jgi:hypothetical protein
VEQEPARPAGEFDRLLLSVISVQVNGCSISYAYVSVVTVSAYVQSENFENGTYVQ